MTTAENKALVMESPFHLKLHKMPIRVPRDGEVLVRTRYNALCGSDIKLYLGEYTAPHRYPVVIGHEWVGEVVEIGPGVTGEWDVGGIVTGDCSIYCGSCSNCLRNDKNHCVSVEKMGITRDGGCAQYITVNQRHIYRCPQLADLKALALVEPLAVSTEAVLNHISKPDLEMVRSALIIGAGGIGAMAALLLIEEGVPHITVVDIVEDKLKIVESFGFGNVAVIQTDLNDEAISRDKGFDLIIEAAGSRLGLQKAIELANPRGQVVCLGHQTKLELDFSLIMKKSLTIVTSIGSTGGFERAIQIIEKHYRNVQKLITRIVEISEAEEYFTTDLRRRNDVKVLIDLA